MIPSSAPSHQGMRVRMMPLRGLTTVGVLSEVYYFQCGPMESVTLSRQFTHNDYDTVSGKQYSRPGSRQLATVGFESVILTQTDAWFVEDFPEGSLHELRKGLEDVCNSGTPFQLTMYRLDPGQALDTWADFPATMRSLEITEKMGEPDALYIKVEFVQWRDPLVRDNWQRGGRQFPLTINLYKDGTYEGVRTNGEPLTLATIAKYVYGRPGSAAGVRKMLGIHKWGAHTPLVKLDRFKQGGKIVCKRIDNWPHHSHHRN